VCCGKRNDERNKQGEGSAQVEEERQNNDCHTPKVFPTEKKWLDLGRGHHVINVEARDDRTERPKEKIGDAEEGDGNRSLGPSQANIVSGYLFCQNVVKWEEEKENVVDPEEFHFTCKLKVASITYQKHYPH